MEDAELRRTQKEHRDSLLKVTPPEIVHFVYLGDNNHIYARLFFLNDVKVNLVYSLTDAVTKKALSVPFPPLYKMENLPIGIARSVLINLLDAEEFNQAVLSTTKFKFVLNYESVYYKETYGPNLHKSITEYYILDSLKKQLIRVEQ